MDENQSLSKVSMPTQSGSEEVRVLVVFIRNIELLDIGVAYREMTLHP